MIAMNSYRFNYTMDLWGLKDVTVKGLLDRWNDIYRYASTEESEDDVYFLADCMDVLNEKVKALTESESAIVLSRARSDLEAISIGKSVLRLAG